MRILITAGGTREYIDPVRFISNASSGRMGYALARAAIKTGHTVTLITAPTSLRIPNGVSVTNVETAAQMFEAVKKHFRRCDCLIMAAAVADYTPARPVKTKIKKTGQSITLQLQPTSDILKWAGKHKKEDQIIVGFALWWWTTCNPQRFQKDEDEKPRILILTVDDRGQLVEQARKLLTERER